MTFSELAGVCKDKAGLLAAMMRAAGLNQTFIALTRAGARVDNVPADQFNHAVVAWRPPGGDFRLFDPTWAPLSRLDWSNAEAEQDYLVATPAGEELRRTPAQPPEANTLEIKVSARADREGNLKADVVLSGSGYMETALRRWFGFRPRHQWRPMMARMVRRMGGGSRLHKFELLPGTVEDLEQDFRVRFSLASPHHHAPEEGGTVMQPLSFGLFVDEKPVAENLLDVPADARRGLRFRCAKVIHYRETVALPHRYQVAVWEDIHVANDLGSVNATVRTRGRKLTAEADLIFSTRTVPVERLGEYRQLMDAAAQLSHAVVVLSREGRR